MTFNSTNVVFLGDDGAVLVIGIGVDARERADAAAGGPGAGALAVGDGNALAPLDERQHIAPREAHRIGLVDHVVPSDKLDEAVEETVTRLLATCSVGARQSKILLGLHADLSQPAFFEEYLRRQKLCIESDDHVEARNAYREGRTPQWS